MNIQARLQDIDAKLRSSRAVGGCAFAGIVLLYGALLVPVVEAKPVMAFCVTLAITCQIPFFLRWHARVVERRVLAELAENGD